MIYLINPYSFNNIKNETKENLKPFYPTKRKFIYVINSIHKSINGMQPI